MSEGYRESTETIIDEDLWDDRPMIIDREGWGDIGSGDWGG